MLSARTWPLRTVHWGAVIAGTLTALSVQLILTLLGIGIGAAAIDPASRADNGDGLGTGVIVWSIVSGLIAFGLGGYVTGNTLGMGRQCSGAVHGFMAWALAAVFGVMITTLSGAVMAGGASIGASNLVRMDTRAGSGAFLGTRGAGTDAGATDRASTTATDVNQRPIDPVTAREARDVVAKSMLWAAVALLAGATAATVGGAIGRRYWPLAWDETTDRQRSPAGNPTPAI